MSHMAMATDVNYPKTKTIKPFCAASCEGLEQLVSPGAQRRLGGKDGAFQTEEFIVVIAVSRLRFASVLAKSESCRIGANASRHWASGIRFQGARTLAAILQR